MPVAVLERQIESKVKDYARSRGFLAYKFTSPGHAFVPDGLFISPKGVVFFIEFKRKGCVPTPGQFREHQRLIAHGVSVYVIDSADTGKSVIDTYANP